MEVPHLGQKRRDKGAPDFVAASVYSVNWVSEVTLKLSIGKKALYEAMEPPETLQCVQ